MNTGESSICFNCMSPLGGDTICPRCGHDSEAEYNTEYKRPGSVLVSRYLVGWLRQKNGESALYKGYDRTQRTTVWIREYFPRTIAARDVFTGKISAKDGYEAQYKALMSDFVDMCNEVRRLSVSDPVVPIDDVVAEDNTVYAIYRDLRLVSLESFLGKRGGKLPADQAMDLLVPFYNALDNIHSRGEIHRGISPYTVFVNPRENKLYLWGFSIGAARTGGSELEAELFNGYSAPEQYASNGWQGAWTDVYAAAALLYRTVSGFVPPKATLITRERPLAPLFDLVMDISPQISDAVEEAMEPATEDRTQSMGAFVARLLDGEQEENTSVYDVNRVNRAKRESHQPRQPRPKTKKQRQSGGAKYIFLALFITALVLGGVVYFLTTVYFSDMIGFDSNESRNSSRPGSSQSSLPDDDGEEAADPSASQEQPADVRVPNFIGRRATEIMTDEAYLSRYEFSAREEYNDEYEEGFVYGQSPEEGTEMPNRGTVILNVSKGKMKMQMPDLSGMTLEEADKALKEMAEEHSYDAALTYTTHEQVYPSVEPGEIIRTLPAAGEEFDPRSSQIVIYVSRESSVSETIPSQPSSESSSSRQESSRPPSTSTPGGKDEFGIDT